MLRIWAVIAGLFILASSFVGQVPLGTARDAKVATRPAPAASAAFDPAGTAAAPGQGADPVPQVMQVYVMSSGPSGQAGASGNVAAAQTPGGLESQGTAFYLEAGGEKVVVAPYHAWVLAGASLDSAQVYLAGQVKDAVAPENQWQSGGLPYKWTWWSEQARVLGSDPADDVVFLAVPQALKDVNALELAGSVFVGDQLHGTGYAGGMIQPNGFSGNITYFGTETEVAGTTSGWQLNFQGYGMQGNGVKPGDSGSPALTADGRVAGEVVAAGNGWILVVPSTSIKQALTSLPAA